MKHLSNDYKSRPNQHENCCKLCYEKECPLLNFFKIVMIHSKQEGTATIRYGVPRKRSTKRLKHTGNLFRKNLGLKGVC